MRTLDLDPPPSRSRFPLHLDLDPTRASSPLFILKIIIIIKCRLQLLLNNNYYCFYKKILLFHIHIHFLKNYYMQQKIKINYLWRTSGWCAIAICKKIY